MDVTREQVSEVLLKAGYKRTDSFDAQHDDYFFDQWERGEGNSIILVRNDRDGETVKIFQEVGDGPDLIAWLNGERPPT
jgi:hypothetical protein